MSLLKAIRWFQYTRLREWEWAVYFSPKDFLFFGSNHHRVEDGHLTAWCGHSLGCRREVDIELLDNTCNLRSIVKPLADKKSAPNKQSWLTSLATRTPWMKSVPAKLILHLVWPKIDSGSPLAVTTGPSVSCCNLCENFLLDCPCSHNRWWMMVTAEPVSTSSCDGTPLTCPSTKIACCVALLTILHGSVCYWAGFIGSAAGVVPKVPATARFPDSFVGCGPAICTTNIR